MPFQPPHRSGRLLLGALVSALAWCLAVPAPGQAGAYRITYDFGSDLSGWSAYVEPGWMDCSRLTPAGCPDLSTLRVMARPGAARADWSQGRWEWTAPPGSVIASGALTYRVRTSDAGVTARVKVKNEDVPWSAATTLASDLHYPTLTTLAAGIPGGYHQLGVALSAHPAMAAASVADPWADYVTLQSLDVIVQENGPPAVAWADGGGLLDGAWHHGEPMCARVHAEDGTAGVAVVTLGSGPASHVWSPPPTGSVYRPGPGAVEPTLCLGGGEVGDGVHSGALGVRDAAGNDGAPLPFVVRVDSVPPTAAFTGPGASTGERRPLLALDVGDATSGVASAALTVDGAPLAGGAGRLSARPAADLAYGRHVVAWRVLDVSGLATEGSASFVVIDTVPPVIGGLRPGDGEAVAQSRPVVGYSARDDGAGVDPARLSLTLDGTPVGLAWDDAGTATGEPAADLAPGSHLLEATATDRAGNAARRSWRFTVSPAAGGPSAAPAPSGGTGPAAPSTGPAAVRPHRKRSPLRLLGLRLAAGWRRGLRVAVGVRALRAGHPVTDLAVRLRVRGCGRTSAMTRRTDSAGLVRVHRICGQAVAVEARAAGAGVEVVVSALRLVVGLHAAPARPAPGQAVRVRGAAALIRRRVIVLEALSVGGWHALVRARADGHGRFRLALLVPRPGHYLLRVRVPALRVASETLTVRTR
jgi:hypothetical protein